MTKIDEVAQTSLSFVNGDDVRFDGDRADDDLKEEFLSSGSSGLVLT